MVCDAQDLSYYGASTLAQRLRLSTEELGVARQQHQAAPCTAPSVPAPAPAGDTTGPATR